MSENFDFNIDNYSTDNLISFFRLNNNYDFEDLDKTHKKIRDNYKEIKSTHLEKLGSKILKNEEKFRKLKEKKN